MQLANSRYLVAMILFTVIVTFQNCSEQQFSAANSRSSESVEPGIHTGTDTTTNPPTTGNPNVQQPPVQNPPVPQPPVPQPPVVNNPPTTPNVCNIQTVSGGYCGQNGSFAATIASTKASGAACQSFCASKGASCCVEISVPARPSTPGGTYCYASSGTLVRSSPPPPTAGRSNSFACGYGGATSIGYKCSNQPNPATIAPSYNQTTDAFRDATYLQTHPDVARAGLTGIGHYVSHGCNERRSINTVYESAYKSRFNGQDYLCGYQDLAWNGVDAWEHFQRHGLDEGRAIRCR